MNVSWFSKLNLSAKLQTATFLLIVALSIFDFFTLIFSLKSNFKTIKSAKYKN